VARISPRGTASWGRCLPRRRCWPSRATRC